MRYLLQWTIVFPILAWLMLFSGFVSVNIFTIIISTLLLVLSVMSSVHHSEIVAHKVGEPFGTIILAICVTILEVSIIIALMTSNPEDAVTLARDTVFAAVMIIINGILGLSIFVGALKHHEQKYNVHGVLIALVSLISIVVLTLVFPNYTTSIKGPYYNLSQLIFVSIACLLIYCFFIFAQTQRHREYFLCTKSSDTHSTAITNKEAILSLVFLVISLGIVVMMSKSLSPTLEHIVVSNNLPHSLVGIIIAGVILLPEGIAALIAAYNNKLQISINLALGSALASIGLTIPSVAFISYIYDFNIALGIDIKSIFLLGLSVFTLLLSLISGRSNMVYGVVLIVNFSAYIFMIIFP